MLERGEMMAEKQTQDTFGSDVTIIKSGENLGVYVDGNRLKYVSAVNCDVEPEKVQTISIEVYVNKFTVIEREGL